MRRLNLTQACISPPELDEKQLLMYLNGDADDVTILHLQRCEFCRERAEALDRFQKRLTSQIYRVTCPSAMELGEYHLDLLPDPQRLMVAQHVRQCPHCSRELTELRDFLKDLTPEASFLEPVKVLFARLTGTASSPVLALRGQMKGPLIFEADNVVITLDIQPDSHGQVSIYGQIAADDQEEWMGGIVQLLQANMTGLTTDLDDLGAFSFEQVHPGSTQFKIRSPKGIEVDIPDIDIAV